MRVGTERFLHDERGAGMPEYALLLFAVLLLGAAGVKKISPAIVNGADTTRRILSGEDVNVTGNVGNAVSGIANATQGSLDPNGDGNSVGSSGTSSGGSNSSAGGGSISGGGAGGGGSTTVGGGGSGTSNAIAGASAGGGGVLLGATGSSAFGGGDNLGGGGGLALGSFSTESASGGGSGGGNGGSGSGNGFSTGGGSSAFAASNGGSPFAGAGNALAALFAPASSQSSRAASSAGASSGSANEEVGKNGAKSTQSQMPLGLLGASRSNEVNPPPGQGAVNGPGYTISAAGEQQMQALLAQARRNVGGRRPKGKCYHQVKVDIQEVGYGNIPRQTANGQLRPLPGSDQGYARNFADYMNARAANGQTNAQNLGLQRLPITNPYDAPPGSIIVVRAGTPGTRNPVAGDIVVAGGNGHFYNDGNMGYGGSRNFPPGNNYVLGIYAPR